MGTTNSHLIKFLRFEVFPFEIVIDDDGQERKLACSISQWRSLSRIELFLDFDCLEIGQSATYP